MAVVQFRPRVELGMFSTRQISLVKKKRVMVEDYILAFVLNHPIIHMYEKNIQHTSTVI